MILIGDVELKPTIFPDKTSQVWKLPKENLEYFYKENFAEVTWVFESEAEIIHLAQLKTLLDTYVDDVHLHMFYVPYARQDKRVDNNATFAFRTFAKILNSLGFSVVRVLDFHNKSRLSLINNVEELPVSVYIYKAIDLTRADLLLYPDHGARIRYSNCEYGLNYVYAIKDRDQLTGYIKKVNLTGAVRGKKVLIVDDICDGGMTFKLVAEKALKAGAKEVHLYTTHGIFSKGLQTLRDSGIKKIFTWKGEEK